MGLLSDPECYSLRLFLMLKRHDFIGALGLEIRNEARARFPIYAIQARIAKMPLERNIER